MKIFLKVAAMTLVYVCVFDVVGMLIATVLDILGALPIRGHSSALYYVVWFVLGVFAGMLIYGGSGKWITGRPEAEFEQSEANRRIGPLVIAGTCVTLAILSGAFYAIWWRYPTEPSFYVPDSMSCTLTFFISIFLATIFAHKTFGPGGKVYRPSGTPGAIIGGSQPPADEP